MKLISFRIQNYRSVNDSGWIDIGDIASVIGKNESGKTSLLKALWKFNPFTENPYSLEREWPRGRRRERSLDALVVSCKFLFSDNEREQLAAVDESCADITEVLINKKYNGRFTYTFLPQHPPTEHGLQWVISELQEHLQKIPEAASPHFKNQYTPAFKKLVTDVENNGGSAHAIESLPNFKNQLAGFRSPDANHHANDDASILFLQQQVDTAVGRLSIAPTSRRAIDTAHKWLPTFIYMDDYRVFSGRAQLDQVKARIDSNSATDEDETIVMIMRQAGLELHNEVRKGKEVDREQRMLDMNDASQTLTNDIANRWSQKPYEVMFQADGQHFIMFVKDEHSKVLVPLEERSKGFQWFFSFDMTFMCETDGDFENAVILLDEPGLHLHASAQRDLLTRMYEYARNNQLIYTTHLPFMVDPKRLEAIHICEETTHGTKVHQNWQTADRDSRFTLQAALGLSWSQSLFIGQYNLIVEGVTDLWYLTGVSDLFEEAGETGLDGNLIVTPAGGASKVAYVGTILKGQELDVCVLLDSDTAGDAAFEQLVHQWILEEKLAFRIGQILGEADPVAIEDLFSTDYFLGHANEAYSKELAGKPITLKKNDKRSILDQIADALEQRGVKTFNKGRVAKHIVREMSMKKLSDYDQETVEKFKKIFKVLNGAVAQWKAAQEQPKLVKTY